MQPVKLSFRFAVNGRKFTKIQKGEFAVINLLLTVKEITNFSFWSAKNVKRFIKITNQSFQLLCFQQDLLQQLHRSSSWFFFFFFKLARVFIKMFHMNSLRIQERWMHPALFKHEFMKCQYTFNVPTLVAKNEFKRPFPLYGMYLTFL